MVEEVATVAQVDEGDLEAGEELVEQAAVAVVRLRYVRTAE